MSNLVTKVRECISSNDLPALRDLFQKHRKVLGKAIAEHDADNAGGSVLFQALERDDRSELLAFLLQNVNYSGLDDLQNDDGLNAVSYLAHRGAAALLRTLLEYAGKKIDLEYEHGDGARALHLAVLYEEESGGAHNPCLALLVERGANVNALSWQEGTPLHLAIKEEAFQNARYLLSQRAQRLDFRLCDAVQNTIIHDLIFLRQRELWDLLMEQVSALDSAAVREIANQKNRDGNKILHEAAMVSNVDGYFLEFITLNKDFLQVDLNEKNKEGLTYREVQEKYEKSVVFKGISQPTPEDSEKARIRDLSSASGAYFARPVPVGGNAQQAMTDSSQTKSGLPTPAEDKQQSGTAQEQAPTHKEEPNKPSEEKARISLNEARG